MSGEVNSERLKYINSMTEFLKEKKEKLYGVLQRLGLSADELLKDEEKKVCPFNKGHIVPGKSFQKHVESCRLLSAGCQRDELPTLLQNVDFWYENTDSVMKIEIEEKLLNKIIWDHSVQHGQVYTGHRTMPVSHIDENILLTPEDRLAVYNYVVKKSHEAGKVIPVDRSDELLTTDWGSLVKKGFLDAQNNSQYASKLEQLAALRDMRRRRQSYRAKNVHITKKSYTEIIREVISNQMEILVPASTSDETLGTNEGDFIDNRSESEKYKTERDKRKDGNLYRREFEKEHRGDFNKRRSKDRERRGSRERYRHRDRSEERYSTSRDASYSRDRGYDLDRYKIKEEDDSSQYGSDRPRCFTETSDSQPSARIFTEGYNLQPSGDRPRKFTELDGSQPATERPRRFTEAGDSQPSTASPWFTEVIDVLLKEIKKEPVDDESSFLSSSVSLPNIELPQLEKLKDDDGASEKSDLSRKRSHSDSDSTSNSSRRHRKHKKSKHKKKHSKKHKRRD
ncbi:hypothetical protein BsWGS_15312 [Bradybaena similaris]